MKGLFVWKPGLARVAQCVQYCSCKTRRVVFEGNAREFWQTGDAGSVGLFGRVCKTSGGAGSAERDYV